MSLSVLPSALEGALSGPRGVSQLWPLPPLPPPLPSNGGFPLSLPLSARLLVEAALAELGIKAGPLNLPLETAEGPVEAFVVLDENFQTDHAPFMGFDYKHIKLENRPNQGNRPSRCSVWE